MLYTRFPLPSMHAHQRTSHFGFGTWPSRWLVQGTAAEQVSSPQRRLGAHVAILLLPVGPVEGQGGNAERLKGGCEGTQDAIDDVCKHSPWGR